MVEYNDNTYYTNTAVDTTGGAPAMSEILDDLVLRFLLNLPEEDYNSMERLFFHIEEAHWFYEDFYRENAKKQGYSLPSLSFKDFAVRIFNHHPFLAPYKHGVEEYTRSFLCYKTKVPVCGAIILNKNLDKVLLVRGYNSNTWSFPRGKISKDEDEANCAIREVKEEIGFDISPYLKEQDFLKQNVRGQTIKLFIIAGVPEDTFFQTLTRKEIRSIQWHFIDSLLKNHNNNQRKFYMIQCFLKQLNGWIKTRKSNRSHQYSSQQNAAAVQYQSNQTPVSTQKMSRGRGFSTPNKHITYHGSQGNTQFPQHPHTAPTKQRQERKKFNYSTSPPRNITFDSPEKQREVKSSSTSSDSLFSFSFNTDEIFA
jgi:mRNA-decapping enzyme subunit 2